MSASTTCPHDKYFWPDRQYVPLPLPDRNREFSYEYLEGIDKFVVMQRIRQLLGAQPTHPTLNP
jgi:hypothetical protein